MHFVNIFKTLLLTGVHMRCIIKGKMRKNRFRIKNVKGKLEET